MPVKDRGVGREAADDRVAGVANPGRREPDLRGLARPDLGTERPRDQLGTEADAERRQPGLDRLPEPIALDHQSRMGVGFPHPHRTAHEDRTRNLPVARELVPVERPDGDHAAVPERLEDPVRPLPGHVLDDEQRIGPAHDGKEIRRYGWCVGKKVARNSRPEPQALPAMAIGAQARGAAAIGALAVGAAAVGGFAIGRLTVGRLAIRRAKIGKLEVEELDVGRLRIRDGQPPV